VCLGVESPRFRRGDKKYGILYINVRRNSTNGFAAEGGIQLKFEVLVTVLGDFGARLASASRAVAASNHSPV
jgi:hypothetical protein